MTYNNRFYSNLTHRDHAYQQQICQQKISSQLNMRRNQIKNSRINTTLMEKNSESQILMFDQQNIEQYSEKQIIKHLIDQIQKDKRPAAFFLDIDGTLADFKENPDDCFIPTDTLNHIQYFIDHDVPVIAVTGRDIRAANKLFESVKLPIAALHGLEIYIADKNILAEQPSNMTDIRIIYEYLCFQCQNHPDLMIENKKSSIALHYRKNPALEDTAKNIMCRIQRKYPDLKLISGKFVFELIANQANKGRAINDLVQHLGLQQHTLIFIGDDVTDEDGFKIINAHSHGMSIKVGKGASIAHHRLSDTRAVADFLNQYRNSISAQFSQNQKQVGEA